MVKSDLLKQIFNVFVLSYFDFILFKERSPIDNMRIQFSLNINYNQYKYYNKDF